MSIYSVNILSVRLSVMLQSFANYGCFHPCLLYNISKIEILLITKLLPLLYLKYQKVFENHISFLKVSFSMFKIGLSVRNNNYTNSLQYKQNVKTNNPTNTFAITNSFLSDDLENIIEF